MKEISLARSILVAFSLSIIGFAAHAESAPASITMLEFANDNTLFVADPDDGQILAYQLPEAIAPKISKSYNLDNSGTQIAKLLGTTSHQLSYHDIAVHPVSKAVYLSVSVQNDKGRMPALVRVNQAGDFSKVDLASLKNTSKKISNIATDKVKFWRDIPATTLSITDLDYVDGTLYVSSLSTGEFASTLRKVSYPFDDKSNTSNIEIYHTVHDQTETRAPIRAMTILDLDGVKTVVAAYTCTPLVTIPVSALKDGAHVKGKTVAELGYGNTPLDVIHFTAFNEQQKKEDYVLVFHKERGADLINVADLVSANKKEGLSKPEMWAKAGVKTRPLPLAGVLQAADQDEQFFVTLKRNLITGDVDLVSYRKGAYFRLNDFISEYNFPDYNYPAEQKMFREYQNMLKKDSGFEGLVR